MSVSRFLRARLCLALFALAAASGAHAAPGDFLTPEFLLNPDHSGNQYSDLASDAAGRILAIGEPMSGTTADIAGRRYAADGTSLGATLALVPAGPRVVRFGSQALAMAADGRFVIVYIASIDRLLPARQAPYAVYAQRFGADGTPTGAEIRVSEILSMPQAAEPAVGISAAGDFVVAWVGFSELGLGSPFTPLATDGLESRVYSQRFTADGRKRGGNEVLARGFNYVLIKRTGSGANLALSQTGSLHDARIAVEADGDYAVAWNRNLPAPAFRQDIELRTYTADGTPRAPLRVIVQDLVQAPLQDLAALADGFVAAWNVDGSPRLQRFAADGSAAGTEFAFAGTAGRSGTAAIAAAADGTVLWAVTVADGVDAPDVAAQLFDAAGSPVGVPFTVHGLLAGTQDRPRVAVDGDGNFVVGWRYDAPGFGLAELRARRVEGF